MGLIVGFGKSSGRGGGKLRSVVVTSLPDTGTSGIIYLVPKEGSGEDLFSEYIWVNNTWELIGNSKIDLSDYVTKEYLTETLGTFSSDIDDIKLTQLYHTQSLDDILEAIKSINTNIDNVTSTLDEVLDNVYSTEDDWEIIE